MMPQKPLHPEFIRHLLAGENTYRLQVRFGVARSVIERWKRLPEVVEAMKIAGMAPEEEQAAPTAAPSSSPHALAVVERPPEAPPSAPSRAERPPATRDPSEAAGAIQREAARHAESIVETLTALMESDEVPPAARIVAADKLAGYLPAPPRPKPTPIAIPKTAVEFYEWMFLEVREQFRANASNPAAQMAAARRLESAWSALKDAREAEIKRTGGFAAAMAAIEDMCRSKPIGVVDELIARLVAVREERAPTATA